MLAVWRLGGTGVQVVTDGVCVCVFPKEHHLNGKNSLGMLPISPVAGFRRPGPGFYPEGRLQKNRKYLATDLR